MKNGAITISVVYSSSDKKVCVVIMGINSCTSDDDEGKTNITLSFGEAKNAQVLYVKFSGDQPVRISDLKIIYGKTFVINFLFLSYRDVF